MNIAMRKLAMLEKEFIQREETARIEGMATNTVDLALKERITKLMDKIRSI